MIEFNQDTRQFSVSQDRLDRAQFKADITQQRVGESFWKRYLSNLRSSFETSPGKSVNVIHPGMIFRPATALVRTAIGHLRRTSKAAKYQKRLERLQRKANKE